MTVRQLAHDFFESDELRTLFMRAAATSTGCFPDDQMGLQGLLHVLPLTLSIEPAAIAVGGSQSISDALVGAGRRLGVRYFTRCEVDRVLVEAGRAAGIELGDGSRVRARTVVSGLGMPQTVLRLLRDQSVAARILQRLRNVHYDRGQLFWANVAVHELPRYLAAAGNPGLGMQPRLYWGPKDPDYLALRYQPEIFLNGFASRPYVLCSADTIWDTSRAPEGKHLIGVEEFAAPFRLFSKRRWREIREEFGRHLLREWRRYAPNMTDENVVSLRVFGPDNILAT